MPEKLSWLPTNNRLFYVNLFIYSLIIVIAVVFSHELMWAQKALRGYLWSSNFDPPADMILSKEAQIYLAPDGDLDHAQQLLEKAIGIDPYSRAHYYLGNCFVLQQKTDDALNSYERFRHIDPSYWRLYLNSIRLLADKKDINALEDLLLNGIETFKKRVDQYQPRPDESVEQPFNEKAAKTYQVSVEVLKRLQEELNRVRAIKQNLNDTNP